jgi:Rrf2 family transcriptional regulator, cysteine metabolism repressor
MKISTKGRYGLRAMLDLAINSKTNHVALGSIAERQGISESYLEQMFSVLRKAELVKSIKGPQGGYTLARSGNSITIGCILRALEGNLSVIGKEVVNSNKEGFNLEDCIKQNVWDRLNESINSVVDSLTLEDLVEDFKKMSGDGDYMFYI